VGASARRAPGPLAAGEPDRLEPSRGGLLFGARPKRGSETGPNPTDRGRAGSKHHLLVDGRGTPLAALLTAANRHDVTQLLPLLTAVPPVAGKPGPPRRKPAELYADRAYRSRAHRRTLAKRGIALRVANAGDPHGSGLGRKRWVVERTVSWPHQFRRLRTRYERHADLHQALLTLGCCVICARLL
jgi:transposase